MATKVEAGVVAESGAMAAEVAVEVDVTLAAGSEMVVESMAAVGSGMLPDVVSAISSAVLFEPSAIALTKSWENFFDLPVGTGLWLSERLARRLGAEAAGLKWAATKAICSASDNEPRSASDKGGLYSVGRFGSAAGAVSERGSVIEAA